MQKKKTAAAKRQKLKNFSKTPVFEPLVHRPQIEDQLELAHCHLKANCERLQQTGTWQ